MATWSRDPDAWTNGNGSYTLTLINLPPHAEAQVYMYTDGSFEVDPPPGADYMTHVKDDRSITFNVLDGNWDWDGDTFAHHADTLTITWSASDAEAGDHWHVGHVGVTLATPEVVLEPRDSAEEMGQAGGWVLRRYNDFGVADITVNLADTGLGTATSGVDHAALPTSMLIPVGVTEVPIDIEVIDDLEPEWTETIFYEIAAATEPASPYIKLDWYGSPVRSDIADLDAVGAFFAGDPVIGNSDDDNDNGIADYYDPGPYVDDDLVPVDPTLPAGPVPDGATILIRANNSKVRLWRNPDKTGLLIGQSTQDFWSSLYGPVPTRVYMEVLAGSFSEAENEKAYVKVEAMDFARSPRREGGRSSLAVNVYLTGYEEQRNVLVEMNDPETGLPTWVFRNEVVGHVPNKVIIGERNVVRVNVEAVAQVRNEDVSWTPSPSFYPFTSWDVNWKEDETDYGRVQHYGNEVGRGEGMATSWSWGKDGDGAITWASVKVGETTISRRFTIDVVKPTVEELRLEIGSLMFYKKSVDKWTVGLYSDGPNGRSPRAGFHWANKVWDPAVGPRPILKTGYFMYVQLAKVHLRTEYIDSNGNQKIWTVKHNNQWGLDTLVPYNALLDGTRQFDFPYANPAGGTEPLQVFLAGYAGDPGGIIGNPSYTIVSTDPDIPGNVKTYGDTRIAERFQTYLLYHPGGANDNWVTLRQVDWSWRADIQRNSTGVTDNILADNAYFRVTTAEINGATAILRTWDKVNVKGTEYTGFSWNNNAPVERAVRVHNLPPVWELNSAWPNRVGDPPIVTTLDPDYRKGDNFYIIDPDQSTSVLQAPFDYGQQY